jgi:hypothetical protein
MVMGPSTRGEDIPMLDSGEEPLAHGISRLEDERAELPPQGRPLVEWTVRLVIAGRQIAEGRRAHRAGTAAFDGAALDKD